MVGRNCPSTDKYVDYKTNICRLAETKSCDICNKNVLGIFWDHGSWRASAIFYEPGHCLSCKLNEYLEGERDHYKDHKRGLIKTWLAEDITDPFLDFFPAENLNTTNLPKAIQVFRDKKMLAPAWELDDMRRKQMHFVVKGNRVDREYGERQRPWTKKELNRQGAIMRSPWIYEKDMDLKGCEGVWMAVDETRRWAHGHRYN